MPTMASPRLGMDGASSKGIVAGQCSTARHRLGWCVRLVFVVATPRQSSQEYRRAEAITGALRHWLTPVRPWAVALPPQAP